MKPTIKLNSRLLPALVILLLAIQSAFPFDGWKILLVGLGGVWLISALWVLSLARGLRLTREMRLGWKQVGDWMQERFSLINRGPAPGLWVEIIDHSTLPDSRASRVIGVSGLNKWQWYTESICNQRGVFTIGPTTVRTGDPFGVYTITIEYPSSSTLMVMPPVVPLPTIDVAPGGRADEGHLSVNTLERAVTTSGVRDYVPGDSLRHIHWPTSARRESLFVRLFDNTPSGDWWIFLDLEAKAQLGKGKDSTEEHGVILAASLADRGLRADRAVGLVAYGQQLVWLPPRPGNSQRWEIMRALALVHPGKQPLSALLDRVRPTFKQLPSLIVITPSLDSRWIEAMAPLKERGVVCTVLLLDPASFGGPGAPAAAPALGLLADLGVAHYLISRSMLDHPKARPGQREWRIMPTGKAVPVGMPRPSGEWKGLA
jgi:uncharacterized protein (DUF58 family)